MSFTIIHITDLHIDSCVDDENDKIKSVCGIINRTKNVSNVLILFTGDISYSGDNNQYEEAKKFFDKMFVALSKRYNVKMCLCPGNHDRFFQNNPGLIFDKKFINSVTKSSYDELFDKNIFLMNNYYEFEKSVSKPTDAINKVVSYYDINFDSDNIRIYSLNSPLLSTYYPKNKSDILEAKTDNNYNNIFIRGQYLDFRRLNKDYVFLISHLPLNYLSIDNRMHILNNYYNSIDAVFSGHIHTDETKEEIKSDKKIVEFTASAIDYKEMSGLSILQCDGEKLFKRIFEYNQNDHKYKEVPNSVVTVSLKNIKSTLFGQIVSNDKMKDIYYVDAFDGTTNISIPIRDIFVFPRLSHSKYNNQTDVKTFETFDLKRARKGITRIQGDIHSGKSVLANYLFEKYRQLGYLPILCTGRDLNDNIRNTIKWKMKELFSSNNRMEDFDAVEKTSRILIIDNLEFGSRILFRDALKQFGSVIFITPSGKDFRSSEEDDEKYEFESFEIEAFYYDKRISLYEKIYDFFDKNSNELVASISFEEMVKDIETKIKEMDFDSTIDPSNLVFITLNYIKRSGFSFSNSDSIYKARLQIKIDKALKERDYKFCTVEIAEIILSYVAMHAYINNLNYFSKQLFVDALDFRNNIYGDKPINNVDAFIRMLVESEILRSKTTNYIEEYAFFDRKMFAHYIGKFAIYKKHNKGDDSYLEMVVKRGIYKPLNMQILFSIASNYDYHTIPNFIIDQIYEEVMKENVIDLNDLQKMLNSIDESKQELSEIETSKEKRKEIRERQGLAEERTRKRYLEHKDDFYYYDESKTVLKKIDDLSNKIDVISVVLNSFAGNLEKEQKTKLVNMLIRLPYSLINIVLDDMLKKMNVIFVRIFDQLSKDYLKNIDYYYIKSFFIAEIHSAILSIFDYGTRMLKNNAIINSVREALEQNADNMHATQRLMLLSFSHDKQMFVSEAEQNIRFNPDKFIENNARLIGRRFCFDNYDWVEKNNGKFLNLVTTGEKDKKYIKEKSRIKK